MSSVRNARDKLRNNSKTLLLVCNAYDIKPILILGIKVWPFSGNLLDGYDSTTVRRPSCKKQRVSEAEMHNLETQLKRLLVGSDGKRYGYFCNRLRAQYSNKDS